MTESSTSRRVDAERNRGRILAAAREAFADPESDASMAEIARRAEVGSATLYRNFASRRDLLHALFVDEIDAVCAAAAGGDGEGPSARLIAWLRRVHAFLTGKHAIAAELLQSGSRGDPLFTDGYARVLAAAEPLLAEAQRTGAVRSDIDAAQVLSMIAAVSRLSGDPADREAILRVTFDGLRVVPAFDGGRSDAAPAEIELAGGDEVTD